MSEGETGLPPDPPVAGRADRGRREAFGGRSRLSVVKDILQHVFTQKMTHTHTNVKRVCGGEVCCEREGADAAQRRGVVIDPVNKQPHSAQLTARWRGGGRVAADIHTPPTPSPMPGGGGAAV